MDQFKYSGKIVPLSEKWRERIYMICMIMNMSLFIIIAIVTNVKFTFENLLNSVLKNNEKIKIKTTLIPKLNIIFLIILFNLLLFFNSCYTNILFFIKNYAPGGTFHLYIFEPASMA